MNGDVGLTVLDARQQLRVIFAQAALILPDHPSQPPAHPQTRLHSDYPRQGGIHLAGRAGRDVYWLALVEHPNRDSIARTSS